MTGVRLRGGVKTETPLDKHTPFTCAARARLCCAPCSVFQYTGFTFHLVVVRSLHWVANSTLRLIIGSSSVHHRFIIGSSSFTTSVGRSRPCAVGHQGPS